MKLRRWVTRWVVVPLVLGAVTCVGVAWGIAAWMPQEGWPYTADVWVQQPNFTLHAEEFRVVGAVRRSWNPASGRIRLEVIDLPRGGWPLGALAVDATSTWRVLSRVSAGTQECSLLGLEHATGWPMHAAWYEVHIPLAANGRGEVSGGITIDDLTYQYAGWVDAHMIRALPLRPIWIGIVIDTLFYAGVWEAALGGVRAARRWRRRRRGLCAACAYELAGVPVEDGVRVCPECGAAE